MVLRLNHQPSIDNLRNYPAEVVDRLRELLASGAPARPDPRRADFYELDNDDQVFYIHISPVTGKVMLLATWLRQLEPAGMAAANQIA